MVPAEIGAAIRRRWSHFLIGCVVAGLALAPAGAAAGLPAAAIATLAAAVALGRRGAVTGIALIALSATSGAWRLEQVDRPAEAAPPGTVIEATATLLERPRPGLFGSSAPMKIESGPAKGLRILARRRESSWDADPGSRFRIRGLVRDPERRPATSTTSAGSAPAGSAPAGSAPSEANAGAPGTPGLGPLPPL